MREEERLHIDDHQPLPCRRRQMRAEGADFLADRGQLSSKAIYRLQTMRLCFDWAVLKPTHSVPNPRSIRGAQKQKCQGSEDRRYNS